MVGGAVSLLIAGFFMLLVLRLSMLSFSSCMRVNDMAASMTAHYRVVPPKIDRRRPIKGKIDCRWSISAVGGRLREKREEEEEEKKKKKRRRKPSACPRPRTVVALACGSPVGRHPRIARAHHRPHPREEKDRDDVKRWVHKSKYYLDIYWFMMK
ncbi:hypothetical protein BHE74_00044873 [Ensete ventricosum]|nr:hypothetical protein BHE74_00044873 [Ensete ventricosum]